MTGDSENLDFIAEIGFETGTEPLVSVVIPAYECFAETLGCLRALAERTPKGLCEAIVVDDGSGDPSFSQLQGIPGLTLKRMARNSGFTLAASAGAELARGKFIFFLNNDTEVRSGWLQPLLETIADPSVGAVGSRLVNPDGTLQEAGSLVWNDGSAANIGYGKDPYQPEVSFTREVDYCSAAALLVPADLYGEVGGFDPIFSPGFYEDTDLCFKIWAQGMRVLYEPRSVVSHIGGATFGTLLSQGKSDRFTKTAELVNRYRFVAKWADELLLHRAPGSISPLDAGRYPASPAVLVIDEKVPEPDRDSGSLRMYWILRLLAERGCRVTLLAANTVRTMPYSEQLAALGIEVWAAAHEREPSSVLWERQGLYDLVIISRPAPIEAFLEQVTIWQPRATVLYDTVDLHELRLRREAELGLAGVTKAAEEAAHIERTTQLERLGIARSDVVATVTEAEAEKVRELSPATPTIVLPNVHESRDDPSPPFADRSGLLFIGSFAHTPNVDAVSYLVQDVLPLLEARLDIKTVLLGSNPPAPVLDLARDRIEVPGYVHDVTPYFDRARVFVAPLRYGAGMKGKLGQAISLGLPVVTTSIGAEGMSLVDGEHVLIADTAETIADAVVRLHEDAELWSRLASNARAHAAKQWSPEAMGERLDGLLADCVPAIRRRTRLRRDDPPPRRPGFPLSTTTWVEDLSGVGLSAARSTLESAVAAATRSPVASASDTTDAGVVDAAHDRLTRHKTAVMMPEGLLAPAAKAFSCNVCGANREIVLSELMRDLASCLSCGSTLRHRAIIAALTTVLDGSPRRLSDIPIRPHVRGTGLSDWPGYAHYLALGFAYRNTHPDREPLLDITKPLATPLCGVHDFVICSDVLAHVPGPPLYAINNLWELLAPGGTLVLTVPYVTEGGTVEHYPELFDYEIVEKRGRQLLVNRTEDGREQIFESVMVGSGLGATPELRVFGLEPLLQQLREAGFADVQLFDAEVPEHGVLYPAAQREVAGFPILATRP
jgi:GT2 family glycosyltransferase